MREMVRLRADSDGAVEVGCETCGATETLIDWDESDMPVSQARAVLLQFTWVHHHLLDQPTD